MKLRSRVVSAGIAIALTKSVAVINTAGNALADDVSDMNKRGLQQMVLCTQKGMQLGAEMHNACSTDSMPITTVVGWAIVTKASSLPKEDLASHAGDFVGKVPTGPITARLS